MRGPPFDAAVFNPADVISTPVGSGTLRFSDPGNGTFDYTVKGIRQTKTITKAVFGRGADVHVRRADEPGTGDQLPGPVVGGADPSRAGGSTSTTRTTRSWRRGSPMTSDGAPLWLAVTAPKTGPACTQGICTGQTGARFDAFDPAAVQSTKVGTATLAFADGNNATFAYTIDGAGAEHGERGRRRSRDGLRAPGHRVPMIRSSAPTDDYRPWAALARASRRRPRSTTGARVECEQRREERRLQGMLVLSCAMRRLCR